MRPSQQSTCCWQCPPAGRQSEGVVGYSKESVVGEDDDNVNVGIVVAGEPVSGNGILLE